MRAAAGRGFTLVETLVAVTLLALLFGALLPVFQNGLFALGRADDNLRAVQLAESLLARGAWLVPGSETAPPAHGEEGHFRWTLVREPYAAEDGLPLPAQEHPQLVLMRVTAVVSWAGDEQGVRLSTLSVERAP